MKKIITALLALSITLSGTVSLAAFDNDEDIINLLSELSIMQGDGDGNYRLDDEVSRAEFTKVAVAASSAKNTVAPGMKISPFGDVPYTHWSAPYIKAAVTAGLVSGYLDGTFRPDDTVLYEEALIILLRLLGYSDSDFSVSWPYGQLGMAEELEMTKNVNANIGEALTRRQIAILIYNTLSANKKDTQTKLITDLNCSLVEDVTIVSSRNEDASLYVDRLYPYSDINLVSLSTIDIYSYNKSFSGDYIGRRGDIIIKDEEVIGFLPYEQIVEEYTVTDIIGKDVVLDGNIFSMHPDITTYYKSQKLTYENAALQAEKGDTFKIFRDKNGILDYAMIVSNTTSSDVNELEKYVIYSQVGDNVVSYKNNLFEQIDIPDNTDCYKDGVKSTYGTVKYQMSMGDVLYVKRNGYDIDYVSYEKGNMEGPVKVTSSSWKESFNTNSSTTVMRDGNKVSADSVQINDIIYYSDELNMILAYTNKVTGIYENASPSKDAPSTVTISGKTYSIEGVDAFNALSSSGSIKYGDTVTALLGRNGDIAGVVTSATTVTQASTVGYVTASGKKDFTNADGNTYSSYYIDIVSADGVVNEYATKSNYDSYVGTVCRVSFRNGEASISKQSSESVSGTVDGIEYRIGSTKLAENVKILDTVITDWYDAVMYKSIYPQRLDGIDISSSSVLYCEKNAAGEISSMILKNVTGDAYTYGAIVSRAGNTGNYIYTIDADGTQYTYTTNVEMPSKSGCRLIMNNGRLEKMEQLGKYTSSVTKLTDTEATIGGKNYKLSDKVLVYKKTDTLQRIPLEYAQSGEYKLTAYYDKTEDKGGRIRIIIAE